MTKYGASVGSLVLKLRPFYRTGHIPYLYESNSPIPPSISARYDTIRRGSCFPSFCHHDEPLQYREVPCLNGYTYMYFVFWPSSLMRNDTIVHDKDPLQ